TIGVGTPIPSGGNVTVNAGQFNIGSLSNTQATAIGTVTLNNSSTFRVPSGAGNYYVNQLVMTGGTVDFSGSASFWLHLTGTGAGITINSGTSNWLATQDPLLSTSRIQNDTAGPLTINVVSGVLNAGIILSAGGSNPNFIKSGGGYMRLSNTGNTANITVAGSYLVSNDLSTDVGAGAFGTLGTGAFSLSGGGLAYDGQ